MYPEGCSRARFSERPREPRMADGGGPRPLKTRRQTRRAVWRRTDTRLHEARRGGGNHFWALPAVIVTFLSISTVSLSLTHTQGKQKKGCRKNSTVCCRRSYCQVSKSNNHLLGYYKDKGVLDIGDFSSRTWYFHHCITVPTTAILSDNLATEGAVIRAHNSVGSPGIGGPKGITCVGRDGFDRTK